MLLADMPADKKPRRVKKPHHLDEFESGFDDEMETPGLPRRSAIDRKRRLPPVLEARCATHQALSCYVANEHCIRISHTNTSLLHQVVDSLNSNNTHAEDWFLLCGFYSLQHDQQYKQVSSAWHGTLLPASGA